MFVSFWFACVSLSECNTCERVCVFLCVFVCVCVCKCVSIRVRVYIYGPNYEHRRRVIKWNYL